MPITPQKQLDAPESNTHTTPQKESTLPNGQEQATSTASETATPVAHVSPLCVFGLPPFWCIVTCPTCDKEGYIQDDVHALPPASSTQCAHGHVYNIKLDKKSEIGEFY